MNFKKLKIYFLWFKFCLVSSLTFIILILIILIFFFILIFLIIIWTIRRIFLIILFIYIGIIIRTFFRIWQRFQNLLNYLILEPEHFWTTNWYFFIPYIQFFHSFCNLFPTLRTRFTNYRIFFVIFSCDPTYFLKLIFN